MRYDYDDEHELRLYAGRKRENHLDENGQPKSLDEVVEIIRPVWKMLTPDVRRTINHFGHMVDESKRRIQP